RQTSRVKQGTILSAFTTLPALTRGEHPAVINDALTLAEFLRLRSLPAIENQLELRDDVDRCLRFFRLRCGQNHLALQPKAERPADMNVSPGPVAPLQRENLTSAKTSPTCDCEDDIERFWDDGDDTVSFSLGVRSSLFDRLVLRNDSRILRRILTLVEVKSSRFPKDEMDERFDTSECLLTHRRSRGDD